MSTQIAKINGRKENIGSTISQPEYIKIDLNINRFYGGKEKGRMLQLTIQQDYIQLTQKQVKELIKVLSDSFDDNVYPSE